MNKVVKLKDWLQDLSDNSNGIIVIEDYGSLMKAIEDYQKDILHELSTGIVRENNIQTLLKTTRQIHSLRNVEFQDESVPQVLLEIFRANLDVLGKLSKDMRQKVEEDLTKKAIEEGTPQEKYEALLNDKVNKLVEQFEEKETERLDKLAERDVEK